MRANIAKKDYCVIVKKEHLFVLGTSCNWCKVVS